MRQVTVIVTGLFHFFRSDFSPLHSGLAFYSLTFLQSVWLSGLLSRTKCLTVFPAISLRKLLFSINISWFYPFFVVQFEYKSRNLCSSCLLTQSKKELLVFFSMIAWTMISRLSSSNFRSFSVPSRRRGWKVPVSVKKLFPFPHLLSCLLSLTW